MFFACLINAIAAAINIGLFYDSPFNLCVGIVNAIIAMACYIAWVID